MNTLGLYYFLEASRDLNFTQTARRLFISQQALSDQIKKLEKHYGARFFERKPRLKLTYEGEQMLSFAEKVLQAEQSLQHALRPQENARRVKLTVAAANTRGGMIPEILSRYLAMYPNVLPSIITGSADALIARLQLEQMDVYFGSYRDTGGAYVSEEITKDELYFLVRRDLMQRVLGADSGTLIRYFRHGIPLAGTARFPITLMPVGKGARTTMDLAFQAVNAVPDVAIETDSNETMFDICFSGLCGGFIMRELLYYQLKKGSITPDLLCFPIRDLYGLNSYGIAYQKGPLPEYISDFVLCCKNALDDAVQTVNGYMDSQCARLDEG